MTSPVAETIFDQLGGRRFQIMTGAKNFIAYPNGLQMDLAGRRKGNRVMITLGILDLYDVTLWTIKNHGLDVRQEATTCVYADQLQEAFTRMTGLDTHL